MISHATDGAAGPHFDSYDVFLSSRRPAALAYQGKRTCLCDPMPLKILAG
jgi:ribosomal protein L16 Arg81 hydroxylase